MKHTPGPWIELSSDVAVNLPHRSALSNTALADWPSDEHFVAEIAYKNEANAQLIAAAPDLLEACEAAYQNLKPAYSSDHLVMRKLIGAIKKATE